MATAASHSRQSSLDELDYYAPSRSSSSSLAGASLLPTAHHTSVGAAHPFPTAPDTIAVPRTAHGTARKQSSLANISVPSFSAFRSQASSVPVSSGTDGAVRRAQATTPRVVSFSSVEKASPRIADPPSRPFSIDSSSFPTQLETPQTQVKRVSHSRYDSIDSRVARSPVSSPSRRSSIPIHASYAREQAMSHAPKQSVSSLGSIYSARKSSGSMSPVQHAQQPLQPPPSMTLQLEGVKRTLTDESINSETSEGKRTNGTSGRLGSIFGWKSSPQRTGTESPSTAFSDHSPNSPLPSPRLNKPLPVMNLSGSRLTPPGLDVQKANAQQTYFPNTETPILIGTPETHAHVKELERELAQVSLELAGSIRREMDLEDEVDRMRAELPNVAASTEPGRRSSDYFSDSGASSTRFPIMDPDSKIDQMERSLRKVEQEKAQIKLEMASRLQTELSRRRDLEQMVQNMEEQLQRKFDEEDERGDIEERVEELETTLEDTRRLLSQERQAKGSFEDLYTATREQLERHKNESDNLRDEVLPQLRSRVEGLEAEAGDTQAIIYENTRMQQELAGLKERFGSRFGMIAEEEDGGGSPVPGGQRGTASRSGSITKGSSKRGGSLTRSGSTREGGSRARSGSLTAPVTAEGLKEIEDQRDALHKALKLLINRHEKQQWEHARAIARFTRSAASPELLKTTTTTTSAERTSPFHREVAVLKDEVATLRRRTEDALERKWQYEKGLSGVKMDLDRAEQETRGLRLLLDESDHPGSSDAPDPAPALRARLASAVEKGEREQRESASKIQDMQNRLAGLEDSVLAAQQHSENALLLREKEIRNIEDAFSPRLRRLGGGGGVGREKNKVGSTHSKLLPPAASSSPLTARFASSPRFAGAHKRLAETSLLEMSRTLVLERKVKELEHLLREAETDMQDVVTRVNASQAEVAELQMEREDALARSRGE